jgi:hypothetical protein
VNETASRPRSRIAIESSAIEMRSPAVSSMSSSRAHDAPPVLGGVDDAARDRGDPVGSAQRRAAVLLDDE